MALFSDPRLCFLLALLMGCLVWKAGPLGLFLYLAGLGWLFSSHAPGRRSGRLYSTLAPGFLRRTLFFALFWATAKFVLDAWEPLPELLCMMQSTAHSIVGEATVSSPGSAALFFPQTIQGLSAPARELARAAGEAGLLFLRLLTVMGVALALTSLTTPRTLGLALTWLLTPLAGARAWQSALALALMAQYVPAIHRRLWLARLAARSRGMPDHGFAYWRVAFFHIFRLLALGTWKQAVAVASRGLDGPERWHFSLPPRPGLFWAALGLACLLTGAALLHLPA